MRPSLARYCLIFFLALELISSGIIYSLSRTVPVKTQSVLTEQQSPNPTLASTISQLTYQLRDTAIRIAQHPQTIYVLKSTQDKERQIHLANIRLLYPEADIQRAPPTGELTSTPFSPPFAVVYTSPQEVSRKNALSMLSIAQPVIDTGSKAILGFVMFSKGGAELQSLFNALQLKQAYAELQQAGSGNQYSVLLHRGDMRLKNSTFQELIDLPGTAWRMVVWHTPPTSIKPEATQPHPYFIAWLFISIGLISALLIFYYALRKTLTEDMNLVVSFFSDIRHSRLRKVYNIQLKDLESNFKLIFQLGRLMLKKHKQVADDASLDHLSQVNNRRSLEEKLRELYKTLENGWTHSLLIIDIDHFKHVNDTFGHDAGDALIVQIGKLLKEHLRSSDFIARLGGDEFCVIFPNTPLKRGAELADRLRKNLPAEVELTPGVKHQLLWSGGLSEFKKDDANENVILSRADSALLEAKRTGRNQTRLTA